MKIYFGPKQILSFIFALGAIAYVGERSGEAASLPDFVADEVVIFAGDKTHPAVKIRTGDIALRYEDPLVALGSFPLIKSVYQEVTSENGNNWDMYREVFQQLHIPMVSNDRVFSSLLKADLTLSTDSEVLFSNLTQKSIPPEFRISIEKLSEMRGQFKPMHFENGPDVSAKDHNYYNLDISEDADNLNAQMHYFPGTPFVSHSGIISIERENGKNVIYVYDAIPNDANNLFGYTSGLRKVPFRQFFANESRWGVIERVKIASSQQAIAAANYAAMIVEEHRNDKNEMFDHHLKWQSDERYVCSTLVWRAYLMGAHLEPLSDLNVLVLPEWAIHMKQRQAAREAIKKGLDPDDSESDFSVSSDLTITPQSFLVSKFTKRIVDFNSDFIRDQFIQIEKGGVPLLLPTDKKDPKTGHPAASVDWD